MARVLDGEAVDTRLALQTYAVAIGICGIACMGWGLYRLGAHLVELPLGRAALVRMAGSVMVASALVAAGLAGTDVAARNRVLPWFIAGHVVVWAMLQLQVIAVAGEPARYAAWAMLAVVFGLLYVRFPGSLPRSAPLSVREADEAQPGAGLPRGPYERQIREAAAQEERNRLARDLHDAVKQQIFAIQASAAAAEARLDTDAAGARAAVAQVRQSAREATREMEAMLDQLRAAPLGHTGLVEAIRKQCDALALRTGAHVDVVIGRLPDEDSLVPGAHEAIHRIVQEALANVGRHARARNVRVSLDDGPDRFEVTVWDDGLGFDGGGTASPGMGLHNMRARAGEIGGTIDVRSSPDAGTCVTLSIPYETVEVTRYRRVQALVFAALVGAGIVALVLDLLENGPDPGNATLVLFVLLFARHVRSLLHARVDRRAPAALTEQDS